MCEENPLVSSTKKNLTLLHTHIDNHDHHLSPCQHKERGYHNYYVFIKSHNTSKVMRCIVLDRSRHVNIWINLSSRWTFRTNTFKVLRLARVVTFWISSIFASSTWIHSWRTTFSTIPCNVYMTISSRISSRKWSEN